LNRIRIFLSFALFTGLLSCLPSFSVGQSVEVRNLGIDLPDEKLKEDIGILSSEFMQGRKTGTIGLQNAANFLVERMTNLELSPFIGMNDHMQEYSLLQDHYFQYNIEAHQKFYLFKEDFFYVHGYKDTSILLDNLLFLGYGISDSIYDDYAGHNVKDKAIILYDGEPPGLSRKIYGRKLEHPTSWSRDWKKKLSVIYEKRPSVVFVIVSKLDNTADSLSNEARHTDFYRLAKAPGSIPVIFISEDLAMNFFPEHEEYRFKIAKKNIDRRTQPFSFSSSTDAVVPIMGRPQDLMGLNIIGMIEGKHKRDEYVVVSAHFDHLGAMDSTFFPGADDNASGVAAILEMARDLVIAKRNGAEFERSIVFCLFSGEEIGLLGSSYFIDHLPIPPSSIIANLNLDMIGRKDTVYDGKLTGNYIYVIGDKDLSKNLLSINEECNSSGPELILDYRFNSPDEPNKFSSRSDHYNFSKVNIPYLFYFNGVHKDYHKVSDTVDKIDLPLLKKRIQLIQLVTMKLAGLIQ